MNIPFYSTHKDRSTELQDRECLIFVEGDDDAFLISTVLEEMGKSNNDSIGILSVGGKTNIKPQLKSFQKSSNFTQGKNKAIAIIFDADDDPAEMLAEINEALADVGSINNNEWLTKDDIKFGIFLFPDGDGKGDLESLCLSSVEGKPRHVEAERCIAVAESLSRQEALPLNGSRFKRLSQVYLAMVPQLCRGAGRGFRQGYFDKDHASINKLKVFLNQMF